MAVVKLEPQGREPSARRRGAEHRLAGQMPPPTPGEALPGSGPPRGRSHGLIQGAFDAIWLVDQGGRILDASDAASSMYGHSLDELLHMGIADLEALEAGPDILARLARVIREGPDRFHATHRRRDGSVFPVEVSMMALPDGTRLVITVRDETERQRTRTFEQASLMELERLVEERTAQVRQLAMEATLADERERQAIASDLHDDLGQLLLVAKLKLEALAKAVPGSDSKPLITELGSLLGEASRTVRSLTSQLSPPVLNTLGLLPALHHLTKEMEDNFGLVVKLEDEGPPVLAPFPQATLLFRAIRELLINVVKHAGSKEALVRVSSQDGFLVLSVEDQGIGLQGLDTVLGMSRGFGLRHIRERLLQLGGALAVEALPGGGTRVSLTVPLPATLESTLEARP